MLTIVVRTLIIYFTLLVFMRIMGKREIGQLSAIDFVVAIAIAELGAIPMEDPNIPLLRGLIPIALLATFQISLSLLCLKNNLFRKVIYGKPNILISNGIIKQKEMKSARYNIDDLLTQLREKSVFNVADVEYAILETSGQLTVSLKPEKRALCPEDMKMNMDFEGIPTTLVDDGEVNYQALGHLGKDMDWLQQEIIKRNIDGLQNVFFANITPKGSVYMVEREEKRKAKNKTSKTS
ncbi:Uncharacterized membrane protein YcaP, DUF421 family [Desulfonispora thiosulfatigenes DSM 11270]|uniref:Uncharacterized membrane protein YcaP, DUF421 family n=1 Tax=Desulfonispora thiosulfatigenes DSM 11270 TaxID=656914 RepID=A0A1W1V7G6_DESTI|nr:DUF421 domain-containing protein [Desulfonispora thiosulfatigenes]SMB89302.1 Uncharacterized membrane protein YcaP, DUF421 family [Desulfonispora thiosulfatigenes DSM 11270]